MTLLRDFVKCRLFVLYFTTRFISSYLKSTRIYNKYNYLKEFDYELLRINNHKKFFILGTGESINRINAEFWNEIKDNVSVGVNSWLIHDFTPDFYFIETPADKNEINDMVINLEIKKHLINKTPIVIKDESKARIEDINLPGGFSFFIKCFMHLPADSEIILRKSLSYLKFLKFLNLNNRIIYTARASVIMLILLAWQLGYREIILCGVDLSNKKYFYDYNKDVYIKKGLKIPLIVSKEGYHSTALNYNKQLNVLEIIKILNEELFSGKSSKLTFISDSSLLGGILNPYNS